ncbi:MAG TPA: carboxyl transferase domain-containing protein [Polyangiaceae bacterium]|nr:carboxyl transferase domain-containing protein [Polyangiaceae bacterium]
MPIFASRIDPSTPAFAENRERMLGRVLEIRSLEQKVRDASAQSADKFKARGQLLPRERVEKLLDPERPFLELSSLAGYKMHDDDGGENIAGGGSIIGIGFVEGVRCLVVANDSAIKGGSISPMGLRKSLRAQEIALGLKLPIVSLVESGGANLLYQAEIFVDGGRVFANMARLSAIGIPQITVVHGSSTAGGAYLPGLSDYVVVVKGKAKVFLAGPPLVKAALGKDATDEELGGAEMHAKVSGLAEYLAQDDAHAIAIGREILAKLGWGDDVPPEPARTFQPPKYDIEDLLGIVPADPRKPYDVREVVARLADGSDFLEFKKDWGAQTVCVHALLEGHRCAFIGNNGPIHPQGAAKAAQFIQACCQSGTPIVYLHNTTGFMVGVDAEERGIIKHGAKMIQAVANATVPQIAVIIGGSFGAGNYGMCGRSFDPSLVFAWPNSRVAVMGGEQAARVMSLITEAKMKRSGAPVDADALAGLHQQVKEKLDVESNALYATARLWDDGIIDPRDTRRVLAFALVSCREAARRKLRPSTFGVARM